MDVVNQFATGGFSDVVSFVGNFLALLVLAGLLFLFALKVGRAAFIALVMSLYVGFALFTVLPYKEALSGDGSAMVAFAANVVVFAALAFFPYTLLRRISTSGSMPINPVLLFGLALLAAGFILALGYHLFSLAAIFPMSSSLDALFAPDKYFFWWFVAPLVGTFLVAR